MFKRYDITDERDIQADGERLARYVDEKAKLADEGRKLERNRLSWRKSVQKFVQRRRSQRGASGTKRLLIQQFNLAPQVGFEPTTLRLT